MKAPFIIMSRDFHWPLRVSLVLFTSLLLICVLCESNSFAESKKAEHKSERIIKRKREVKKPEITHDDIKSPDAIDSSHSFPAISEKALEPEIVEAVILLDSSRSMKKTDPKRIRDQGAKLFLQFLEPADKVSIVEFAESANVLMELEPMSTSSIEDVNSILDGIKNEGNFTNFIPPLEIALELLQSSEEKNSSKVIVLLTDGQMDPGPSTELRDQLIEQLIKEKIPEIRKSRIKVYTIGLSELADKDLLTLLAKKTQGHSEYAQDVNSIHKVFSDLFLSIKKPQVLELESGGFSIDGNTTEATFFINRLLETDTITVIDPTGNEYFNKDFPAGWKWFRGNLFDVITVPAPLPGRWGIKGGAGDLTGFAKLLSNLKLEYSFPSQSYSVGDSAVVKVRLTESGKTIDDPNFADLIFYTYKIIDLKTGQLYLQGQLGDKGVHGDEKLGDGVFSDIINLNEEGEFKLFLVATAPTFTRQAHVPFSVSKGIISLSHIAKNEFTGEAEKYQVTLYSKGKDLTKRVVVIESRQGEEKIQINLEKYKSGDHKYTVPLDRLKSGENRIVAMVQGVDENKEEIRAKSEELLINVATTHPTAGKSDQHGSEDIKIEAEAGEHDDAIEEEHHGVEDQHGEESLHTEEENSKEGEGNLVFGLIGILISLGASFFLGRLFISRAKTEGGDAVVVREEYVVPDELKARIEAMSTMVGTETREFYPAEMILFSDLVSDDIKTEEVGNEAASSEAEGATEGEESSASIESETETEAETEAESNDASVAEAVEEPTEEPTGDSPESPESPVAEEVDAKSEVSEDELSEAEEGTEESGEEVEEDSGDESDEEKE